MILKRLQIRNVRSHVETNVDFNTGITVFTGRTGSGKSTLIMAIEYALFGANARIPNPELLRRRAKSGHVKLEFSHGGHDYTIIRGLRLQGDRVTVDPSNLTLSRDSIRIPLLERAGDLDEKILKILGYPAGVDPVKLFEVTTYSKQDEIRNLIDMKPTERQQYIDKLLQIQRYENTWENLKEIVSSLGNEILVLEEKVRNEALLKEQLDNSKKKVTDIMSKTDSDQRIWASSKRALENLKSSLSKEKEHFDRVLKLKSQYDAAKSQLDSRSKELADIDLEITGLKQKIKKLNEEMPDAPETGSLESKRGGLSSRISQENQRIDELSEKIRDVAKLKGKCPLCGSKITEEHKSQVGSEYKKLLAESQKNVTAFGKDLADAEKLLPKARRRDELKKSIESEKRLLDDKLSRIEKIKSELGSLNSKVKDLQDDVKDYDSLRSRIDISQKKLNDLSSEVASLETAIRAYEEQLHDEKNQITLLEEQLSGFEMIKKELDAKSSAVKLLSELRQHIRGIREAVRTRFLNDLKIEFQRKFEEMRKFEEEYSVDVKLDYEPIAYAGGEEVTISTLSGGEKTSVALSYRLALADIAAQIGGIQESELLMLDEPTTGFDAEDVRALPEALANLKTIPQILIVTHAEELKEAADYKFEVTKESGISRLKLLEM